MPHCSSCQTQADAGANYCPNCGESLQKTELPATEEARTEIRIQFGWSQSKYYEEAVELAENVDTHVVEGEGMNAIHTLELTHEDLQLAERLWNLVEGWKSSSLCIDDELIESSSIWHGGLRCFRDRQDESNGDKYCHAHRWFNHWGCYRIGLPFAESTTWLSWGHWDKAGRWHFDKDKIRDRVEEGAQKHRFCPVLKARDLEAALDQIPDTVDPSENSRWLYPQKIYRQENPNYQDLTTGPRPVRAEIFDEDEFSFELGSHLQHPPLRGLRGVKFGISFPENSNNCFVPIFYVQNKTSSTLK